MEVGLSLELGCASGTTEYRNCSLFLLCGLNIMLSTHNRRKDLILTVRALRQ